MRALTSGVGLGWRPELATDLLLSPKAVDFVEIIAETCFVNPKIAKEVKAIAELWPVIPHGVKLSLGSADGIRQEQVQQLFFLAKDLHAPFVSEHVAFTRSSKREIGHLTQLPRTQEAISVLVRNTDTAKKGLKEFELLLENIAWSFEWPNDEMNEADFYCEVIEQTHCPLLLDLSNLYANAKNAGKNPFEVLRNYPLDKVKMIHLAGGIEENGFYFDTHASQIPTQVFALLAELLMQIGPVPILIERDANFPAFHSLVEEVDKARSISTQNPPVGKYQNVQSNSKQYDDPPSLDGSILIQQQEQIAQELTSLNPPNLHNLPDIPVEHINRAKQILLRKRVDDAMPLLPKLSTLREQILPYAIQIIANIPKAEDKGASLDAWHICHSLINQKPFHQAAQADYLVLKARFIGINPSGQLEPRTAPYIGRIPLGPNKTLWAVKGIGQTAKVSLFER